MLTKELKKLEMNKIVTRQVINSKPLTVQYEVTDYGTQLFPLIHAIAEWGIYHRQYIFNK